MMNSQLILLPALAMGLFTFLVAIRLMLARVKDMKALKVHPQKGQDTKHLKSLLSEKTGWIADNYNHLFEQPVIFYVACFSLAILDAVHITTLSLAWAYVTLRVLHSWVQTTTNVVLLRFNLFLASWLVIVAMLIFGVLAIV
ncbi:MULTISPECIES: MAPEG family protein [Gammaproteobacteria]|uniref:MAPEG family protein n=1 Tax=Gammaproteobacteria TaxID=1236 RepID=UPI000DD0ACDA|nr:MULTISPECIES: MAPEG family protein [Gammaproteobacteria]RTE86597.1 MAPEG family protein [Aliidiomarina sp. B3213]TCZ90848.1 MAPEG family protein [Lysobacter sp. N42]